MARWLVRLRDAIKRVYAFCIPLRFSLLALAILAFAFWFSDQGTGTEWVGYLGTGALTQSMTAKGLVRRNEEQRAHVYEAQQPAEKTKRQFASDVLQRVFDGSAKELMLHALAGRRSSKNEIEELRRLLDDHERKLS